MGITKFDITVNMQQPSGPGPHTQGVVCTATLGAPVEVEAVVGERQVLQYTPDPLTRPLRTDWVVAGGAPVANYVATNDAAVVTPYAQRTGEVDLERTFYFTEAGTATVTLTVRVHVTCPGGVDNDQVVSRTITFHIHAPELTNFTAVMTGPRLFETVAEGTPIMKLQLCGGGWFDKGFVMKGTVRPSNLRMIDGQVRDVQTVLSSRVIDGSTIQSGEYVLDGSVPYQSSLVLRGGGREVMSEDTPSQQFILARYDVEVIEVFRLYLQFRPNKPDAIWVTLARWTWSWRGRAMSTPPPAPRAPWILVDTDYTYKNLPGQTLPGVPASSELPVWRDTIAKVTARRGPLPNAVPPSDPVSAPVIQAAQRASYTPDPSTGPWSPLELHPTSQPGTDLPQDAARQVMLKCPDDWRDPLRPYDPIRARRLVEARLDVKLGPDLTPPPNHHVLAWTSLDVARALGYADVNELPIDLRLAGLDLTTGPGDGAAMYAFHIAVAPFCYDNDLAYWQKRAHGPVGGGPDNTLSGFENSVRAVAAQTGFAVTHGRQLNSSSIELVFSRMPTLTAMQQIAAVPQTYRVTRYKGTLPNPYPDDQ